MIAATSPRIDFHCFHVPSENPKKKVKQSAFRTLGAASSPMLPPSLDHTDEETTRDDALDVDNSTNYPSSPLPTNMGSSNQ